MKTKIRLQKIVRYFLYTLLAVVFLISLVTPFVDWIRHPELSQMQVFLKWWYLWIAMIVSGVLTMFTVNNR